MANSKPTEATSFAKDLDHFYDDRYTMTNNADVFKSLDFSNVAIYGKGKDLDSASDDEKFRHFHQMRLFIESGSTYHHNESGSYKTVITCNLPEQIQYALNSKWQAPLDFGDATFNLMMQIGAQAMPQGYKIPSGTLRVSSLKIWTSTEPLTLDLTIPVIDDGNDVSGTNLVEALEILGSLALPTYNNGSLFYTPPPSPLSLDINYGTVAWDSSKRHPGTFNMSVTNCSRIMLQLGGVLLVDNCVVESVQVQYPNTKAQIMHDYSTIAHRPDFGETGAKYLHPLLAVVKLRISTLEALTAETYAKMLWAKPQADQGKVNADLTPVTNAVNWVIDQIKPNEKKDNNSGNNNP